MSRCQCLHSELSVEGYYAKMDLAQAYLLLQVDNQAEEVQATITHRGAFKVKRF